MSTIRQPKLSAPSSAMPRGRQARGMRRISQLLDAAASVYAEMGYGAATMTAVAARAGASPGTLYQFFPHKEALAEALAGRYLGELEQVCETELSSEIGRLPVAEVVDRVVDPLIAFYIANPGFKALFADPEAPEQLVASALRLHNVVLEHIDALLRALAPGLPTGDRRRCATVTVQLIKALLPVTVAADGDEREALMDEHKTVLRGYLRSVRDAAT